MASADARRRLAIAVGLIAALLGPACPARGERVDVTATDGVQLQAELDGTSGPGVVLVHGAGANRERWAGVARALVERGYRVLRLDLRGHGESEGTADLRAADRDVEGAHRYLLGRKIRPVVLVGEGAGGGAAVVVASRVPVGVAGVAVLGRQPAADGPDPRAARAALRVPLLVLVHEADSDTKAFASAASSARIVVVPDADTVASPRTVPALLELLDATTR